MSNATGEATFSTSGRTVVENTFPLIPRGDYTCKIRQAEVKAANKPGAIPYVAVRAEVENTAIKAGGKNQLLFFNLLCSLKPGSDGVISPERGNGLVAFAKALGTEVEGISVVNRTATIDGNETEQSFLNAKEVADWVTSQDGASFRARVRHSKPTAEYPNPKAEVDRFLPPAA